MEKDYIIDSRVLACYIKDCYEKMMEKKGNDDKEITPIKLQKSLYFCFAYWGGYVRRSNKYKKYSEVEPITLPEKLFNSKIEAWIYGPVVPLVYHEKNLDKYRSKDENPFGDKIVKEFIDDLLNDVLSASDFKLVDVSHQDKCWKKNFKPKSPFHNLEIHPEEIIREYAENINL